MKQFMTWLMLCLVCAFAAGCAVTTKPLMQDEVLNRISKDRESMYKGEEVLKAPLTIEEAMARGVKYNLDHRLKLMEDAVALQQVDLMSFDMLPRLVASAGYTQRDSYNASSSMNVATFQQSLVPSTSQDKGYYNGDLTLTWNILDFGVSYFQAKQQADRAHILTERRRKVVHTIIQQIRQAYWLALGAQQLEDRFEVLLKEVKKAQEDSSSIELEKLQPPLEALNYRKALLEIMKQLETFRDELAQAKPRLASLINLPLGQPFVLDTHAKLEKLNLTDSIEQMEQQALLMRPELLEADYNERISVNETRKAIVRMLPGMEMTVGGHYDSNSFLVNQKWIEGGARVTWNLLNLISGPGQIKIAEKQTEIAEAQRLALGMAILTQVHVAYHDFYSSRRQYELSEQLQDIDSRILVQTVNQAKSGVQNHLNEIRSATAALMAEYRSYQNYATLQNACGQIIATIGEDPLPETVTSHELGALSQVIKTRLTSPETAHCVPAPQEPVVVPAPSSTLSLSEGTIVKGESSKLIWTSSHATICSIAPEVGGVPLRGDVVVSPATTTTYTITCKGEGGTTTSTTTLTVTPPPEVHKQAAAAPAVAQVIQPVVPVPEPALPKAAEPVLCRPTVLSVEFDTGSSFIKPYYFGELKKLADFLKEFPNVRGEITGHTDNVGSWKSNLGLSLRRANSIRNYLAQTFGIDPNRITVKGFGLSKPIADNATVQGKQKNRRIETSFHCEEPLPVNPPSQQKSLVDK